MCTSFADAYFQPQTQSYPINGSSSKFPETHGQTASFFQPLSVNLLFCNRGFDSRKLKVQEEFAFIPDGASQTYVINVEVSVTTRDMPFSK
jgi:hypothetical protein